MLLSLFQLDELMNGNHANRLKQWAIFTLLYMIIPLSLASPLEIPDGVDLYTAGRDIGNIQLLNQADVHEITTEGVTVLQIAPDQDPYQKVEWQFNLGNLIPEDWKYIFIELSFLDVGVGVIQPVLLSDDRFSGKWMEPERKVSFTRLNTRKVRQALFTFSVPQAIRSVSGLPHLKIAGLQNLISLRAHSQVNDTEWDSLKESIPVHMIPLVQLNRPMQITCTVGIPDIGNPPSLEIAIDNIREYAPLAKLLGFTSVECFVRWDLIEPQPGEYDFSHYDQIVTTIDRYGLKWFPNLVITSAFALPDWYVSSHEYEGVQCLEHHEVSQVPSIWNHENQRHVIRVLKAFGDHYEPKGVLEAVRLGPSGNFGEAQFPAGAGKNLGYQGQEMHGHIGWWAGDSYALKDFQNFLKNRYGTINTLNQAWNTDFKEFTGIHPQLPETYRTNRGRLDMTGWYTDSMSQWCAFWAREARAAMPDTRIYQSSGGWGFREAGTDFTAQAESMKSINGGIRLTNETDSFEQNFYATRLAATAARLYGIELGYEPAGYHSARGTVARIFSCASTKADNLYTRHSVLFTDPLSVKKWLENYKVLDDRQAPLVDIAVYYPETMNQLEDGGFRHLYAWGFNPRAAEVRRRIDVDFLDERLINAGFLDRYRVLIFCWGHILEDNILQIIDHWLRDGGTIILPSFPRGLYETIDGDNSVFSRWMLGDTGNGYIFRFKGDMEPISLYGDFIEEVLLSKSSICSWTRDLLRIQHPAKVFFTLFEEGKILALNNSDQPSMITLKGQFSETIPPYSISTFRLEPEKR
jgi:hypothetical protein